MWKEAGKAGTILLMFINFGLFCLIILITLYIHML